MDQGRQYGKTFRVFISYTSDREHMRSFNTARTVLDSPEWPLKSHCGECALDPYDTLQQFLIRAVLSMSDPTGKLPSGMDGVHTSARFRVPSLVPLSASVRR